MIRGSLSVIAATVAVLAAGVAFGESVWVQSDSVQIRSGKGAVYPIVGSAKKGTELGVVSRDAKWVQVQSGQVTGWVFESALSTKKVGGNLELGETPRIAQMDTGAAGRGLQEGAVGYAQGKHYDARPMEYLERINRSVTPAEWEAFNKGISTPAAPPAPGMPPR